MSGEMLGINRLRAWPRNGLKLFADDAGNVSFQRGVHTRELHSKIQGVFTLE